MSIDVPYALGVAAGAAAAAAAAGQPSPADAGYASVTSAVTMGEAQLSPRMQYALGMA